MRETTVSLHSAVPHAKPRRRREVRDPYDGLRPWSVEPLSEDQTAKASPSAVCVLTFPPPDSRRRDAGFSSFIKSHPSQSLNGLVPCIDDAGDLRRRRLRADGHGLSRDGDGIIIVSSF